MKPTKRGCDFCDEFVGGNCNAFYSRYQETPSTRFLLATNNFRVFPSIGQLVEGYLLITPYRHYETLAEMPTELLGELAEICKHVRATLSQAYGPCLSFEHGAHGPADGGCGIYHAHLHATPFPGVSDPVDVLKRRFPYTELAHLREMGKQSASLSSYLFYEDLGARLYLFDTGPLRSQYMRRLLADMLGDKDWNWHTAGREERLLATLQRLSGRFDRIHNPLSPPEG